MLGICVFGQYRVQPGVESTCFAFYDEESGAFDVEGFTHLVTFIQLALEASIHWGQFPTEDVAEKSHLFRTTGIGLANLASLVLMYGYPYDSDESRALAGALAGIMTGCSYHTSALMAQKLGAFKSYDNNAERYEKSHTQSCARGGLSKR